MLFVAPGTIAEAAAAVREDPPTPPHRPDHGARNEGGVFGGVAHDDEVRAELERRASTVPGAEVQAVKDGILEQARTEGRPSPSCSRGIGGFGVIAGILLLVNIFVMLAEERKAELGMLRAVGLQRNHLVRAFGIEGGIYALVATVLGAAVGVGGRPRHRGRHRRAAVRRRRRPRGAAFAVTPGEPRHRRAHRPGHRPRHGVGHERPHRPAHRGRRRARPAASGRATRRGRALLPVAALGVVVGGALLGVGLAP